MRKLRQRVTRLNARPVVGTGTAYVSFRTIAGAQDFIEHFRECSRQERVDSYYLPIAAPDDCHSHNELAAYRHEGHQQMMFLAREARDWSVEMAPRPDDILWDNTKYTVRSHKRRQTIAEVVVLCLIAVMTLLVIVIVLLIGFVYVSCRFNMHPTQADEDEHPVRTHLTQTFGTVEV